MWEILTPFFLSFLALLPGSFHSWCCNSVAAVTMQVPKIQESFFEIQESFPTKGTVVLKVLGGDPCLFPLYPSATWTQPNLVWRTDSRMGIKPWLTSKRTGKGVLGIQRSKEEIWKWNSFWGSWGNIQKQK